MLALLALASLGAAAALLAIPVDLRFDAAAGETLRARLRVEWLFGRVGWDLKQPGRRGRERELPDWRRLSPLWQEAFRDCVAQLLRRWRRWIDIHEVRGRARLGLGDPADTGIAVGFLQPLVVLLDELPRVDLRIDPDFAAAGFQGELSGGIRAVPFGLIGPTVAFVLSPTTLRTFWRLRSHAS